MMRSRSAVLAISAAMVSVSLLSHWSLANPYASGLTESSGVVTFTLNEDADQVTIIRDGVPQNLGAKTAGAVTFNRNGATNYQIQVTKAGGIGYATQIEPNVGGALPIFQDLLSTRFNSPRGVAVNTYTNNLALFGRVYVSNSASGEAPATGTFPDRTTGDGIYALNANMTDALGQGDTARDGGQSANFSQSSNSPFRVTVGADNNLYIADWSDAVGTVWRADPNVTAISNILNGNGGVFPINTSAQNHGSVGGLAVTGSQATGDLKVYTIDEDLQEPPADPNTATELNSLWRYDINGSATPYTAQPSLVASQKLISDFSPGGIYVALARGADGKFYMMQGRSAGNEPGVVVVAADGTTLWDSLSATAAAGLDADPNTAGVQDMLRTARGIAVSPDDKYMAIVRDDSSMVVLPLTNGIPDITKRMVVTGFPAANFGRDIAFDAADNLYVVASAWQAMRVFSPGGISVTTLGSDGSFTVTNSGLPEWNVNGPGNSNDPSKWLQNIVPNSSGAAAKFGSKITSNTTVTVPVPTTYGDILFDNPTSSYTLAGPGPITLNAPIATPGVFVASGNHTVAAPIVLAKDAQVTVAAGSSLTLGGGVTGNFAVNANGAGTTTVSGLNIGALNLSNDTVVKLAAGNHKITSLSIALDPTTGYHGTLDVGNGRLVVDYDPVVGTPSGDIATWIDNARNGGAWDQPGITSSIVKSDPTHKNIIWSEASDFFGISGTQTASWNGQTVDATSILLRATWLGDANLDGKINGDDYALIDRGFAKHLTGWKNGDFDGNGVINSNDYLLIDTSLALSGGAPLSPEFLAMRAAEFGQGYVNQLLSAVPEPGALGLLALAGLGVLARRRSK